MGEAVDLLGTGAHTASNRTQCTVFRSAETAQFASPSIRVNSESGRLQCPPGRSCQPEAAGSSPVAPVKATTGVVAPIAAVQCRGPMAPSWRLGPHIWATSAWSGEMRSVRCPADLAGSPTAAWRSSFAPHHEARPLQAVVRAGVKWGSLSESVPTFGTDVRSRFRNRLPG